MSVDARAGLCVLACVLACVAVLAGCAPVAVPQPTPTPTPVLYPVPDDIGAPGCTPASPILSGEVTGTAAESTTSLRGLLQTPYSIVHTGDNAKLVIRMTGDGEFSTVLVDPSGEIQPLAWGPEEHGGSTYDRPGREWGVGFVAATAGCWEIRSSTDTSSGSFWIDVVD